MYDLLAQVYGYVLGVWRYRWPGLVLAWLVALAGWAYVWTMPEAYKATARLNVDSSSVLRPLLRGLTIQPDVNQRVAMMSRTLLSRPNLEKLMRMSDLDLNIKTELQEEKLLESLKENIRLSGDSRNQSLYSLSYMHEDRDTAKRVVQALITIFIESTLGEKRRDSSGAQVFIDQQIADYELRLAEAEERLADFKQKHVGMLPGDAGGYYARLGQAKGQLKQAQLELEELNKRRDTLKAQLDGEVPISSSGAFGNSQYLSPIDRRIQLLRERLDSLLVNYTDQHPEVLQIRRQIEGLENEKKQAFDLAKQEDDPAAYSDNPVYQNVRAMLTESEARISEMTVRVNEFQNRVNELEDTINNIPEIEVELKQLDRDYNVIRSQHSALLKRREAALLSDKVEQNADDIKFRVIDPPFVPLKPSEPNKLLLNTGVLFVAFGAGVVLSFVISLFKPVYMDRRSLSEKLGLPVLGVVSMVPSPELSRRSIRQAVIFSSLALCLVAVFAGVNVGLSLL